MLTGSIGGIILLIVLGLLSLAVYFLPAIVATIRRHHNFAAIFVLNILVGWTFVGWVVALVWSFTAVDENKSAQTAGTRKIILAVTGIVGALVLIVALFVGGIAFFVFHTIGSSDAANTARTYLRNNETLKQDIGEVKDFGSFVTGNINVSNGDGVATLYLKVMGEKRNVNARVDLLYRDNRAWRVTGASYDRDGQTIDLIQAYGSDPSASPSPVK